MAELLDDPSKAEIVRTEVVAPLADAVRLVDDEELRLSLELAGSERLEAEQLARDVRDGLRPHAVLPSRAGRRSGGLDRRMRSLVDRAVDRGPVDRAPADRAPIQRGPVQRGPVDGGPVDG